MAKFFVVAGEENCAICEGRGYVTVPPSQGGDVLCPVCQGSGARERRLISLEDALAALGILDRLAAAEKRGARADYAASALANGGLPD